MGRLEVQGIVSMKNGLPLVQFRQLDDDDNLEARWQATPAEAREMAQHIVEASMNAVYDAALISWAKTMWPDDEEVGPRLVSLIRDYRADIWGLPDRPEDWRNEGEK
jgi:hypothetical protein